MQSQNKLKNNTSLIGVIGHPIKHSFSPLMHNVSFDIGNLPYVYLPFDVLTSNLEDALKGMNALGIKGFNVTLPHKEKIIDYLTSVSEEAGVIGAVNTVVNDNGALNGFNTDVNGIVATLEPYKEQLNGKVVSVIGSGGASRSVIFALIRYFKIEQINIINRTVEKAERLKDYFAEKMLFNNIKTYELVPPDVVKVLNKSQLIVNSTSIGMSPEIDDTPTEIAESFTKGQIVFDLVYNPLETKFLKLARTNGAIALNGLKMFVEQGAKSFELWTGEKMQVDKIYSTLESYLK